MLAQRAAFFNQHGATWPRRTPRRLDELSWRVTPRHHSSLNDRTQRRTVAYRIDFILRLKMESTSYPAPELTPPTPAIRKRKLKLKRRRRRMRPVLRYTIIGGAIVVLGMAAQFA